MKKDPLTFLLHILESIEKIEQYISHDTLESFLRESERQDAVIRRIEIIGEAAGRISKEDQDRYSNIPWPEIVGLRNRLIHGYDEVDFDILWQIVTTDLPPLIKNLEKLVEDRK